MTRQGRRCRLAPGRGGLPSRRRPQRLPSFPAQPPTASSVPTSESHRSGSDTGRVLHGPPCAAATRGVSFNAGDTRSSPRRPRHAPARPARPAPACASPKELLSNDKPRPTVSGPQIRAGCAAEPRTGCGAALVALRLPPSLRAAARRSAPSPPSPRRPRWASSSSSTTTAMDQSHGSKPWVKARARPCVNRSEETRNQPAGAPSAAVLTGARKHGRVVARQRPASQATSARQPRGSPYAPDHLTRIRPYRHNSACASPYAPLLARTPPPRQRVT